MPRTRAILAALTLLTTAAVIAHAKPGPRKPEFVGNYDITFEGEWTGTGKAKVSTSDVSINEQIPDSTGKKVHIKSGKLLLEDGRFSGDGTIDGVAVTFMGRVEEALAGSTPRITGQISDRAGRKYGRFAGTKKGP